jgi:hypothetical protein
VDTNSLLLVVLTLFWSFVRECLDHLCLLISHFPSSAGLGMADWAFGRRLRSSQLFPFLVLLFRLYIILPAFGKVINLKREFLSLSVRLPMQMRHLNFMLSVIEAVLTGAHGFHKGSNVLQ